jgi:hypothetical protein
MGEWQPTTSPEETLETQAEKVKAHAEDEHRQREPLLGLATNRELIEELRARFTVGLTGVPTGQERKIARIMAALSSELTLEDLNYRTADG